MNFISVDLRRQSTLGSTECLSQPYVSKSLERRARAHNAEAYSATARRDEWITFRGADPAHQVMPLQVEALALRCLGMKPSRCLLVLAGGDLPGKAQIVRGLWQFARAAGSLEHEQGARVVSTPSRTYVNWAELTMKCESPGYSLARELVHDRLVVLNHVGREGILSQDATNRLCQILARREHKSTIITTPFRPAEWRESFEQRVIERLRTNSLIVECSPASPN